MIPLTASTATPPSIGNTWFIALLMGLYYRVLNGTKKTPVTDDTPGQDDAESGDESSTTTSEHTESRSATPSDNGRGRVPTTKAGGRRRKAVRQR